MNEERVMWLWRQAGLPEFFLGNVGTNRHLLEFTRLILWTERERCAKIAEDHECGGDDDFVCQRQNCGMCIAGLIRMA